MIKINTREAIYKLRKDFKQLTGSEFNLAIARSLNRTINKTRTKATKTVRDQYKVKAATVNKSFKITQAKRDSLFAFLVSKGNPLPLIAFGARQTAKGVTVNVMGQRKLIKGAFIATVGSDPENQHKGVFAKGGYKGSQFSFRKTRTRKKGNDLEINELSTSSVPVMISNPKVSALLSQDINEYFPDRLQHELYNLVRSRK